MVAVCSTEIFFYRHTTRPRITSSAAIASPTSAKREDVESHVFFFKSTSQKHAATDR